GMAIHAASLRGHVQIVRSLLQCGADVDVRGIWNWTPLHLASWGGHVDTVQCLLDQGADANLQDNYDRTPLHLAKSHGILDIVRVLSTIRTSIEQDADDRTSLDNAGLVNSDLPV
ncbi:ankyrin repeat protein, partial [Lactarius hatsudake]